MVSQKPLISFIVPIYNAEKFLPQCLKSIQQQSIQSIEIICIDDASSDRSASIVKSFSNTDPRILLIDLQKNVGAGHTRNLGLTKAKGEYVRMVDADDFIPHDSSQKLLDAAIENSSNMVRGGFWRHTVDGEPLRKGGRFPEKRLINGDFSKDRALWFFDQHTTYLFKASTIVKAKAKYSETLRNGEDVAFLVCLAPHMKQVTLIPETVYCYRSNPSSTMLQGKGMQYYSNLFHLYEFEYQQLGKLGYSEQVDSFLLYHLKSILPQIVFPSLVHDLNKADAIEVLSELKHIFDQYNIMELCFEPRYSWQNKHDIPLISKHLVILLANGYLHQAHESLRSSIDNDIKIKKQQQKIQSLLNSTSWRATAPFRKILKLLSPLH